MALAQHTNCNEEGVTLSGLLRLEGEEDPVGGTVVIRSLEDGTLVYSLTASAARGYSCVLQKGRYEVSSRRVGYNAERMIFDLQEDTESDVVLSLMPSVALKTWTTWYDETKGVFGTNNYTDSQHASGIIFATNSETVFFSGNFVIDKWAFQGFSISSGDTHIRFMSRAKGFNIWTMTRTATNIVAENTVKNTCLKDERDGVLPETKSPDTVYPISGSGVQKTWTFTLIIENDTLRIYYDDVWCYVSEQSTAGRESPLKSQFSKVISERGLLQHHLCSPSYG